MERAFLVVWSRTPAAGVVHLTQLVVCQSSFPFRKHGPVLIRHDYSTLSSHLIPLHTTFTKDMPEHYANHNFPPSTSPSSSTVRSNFTIYEVVFRSHKKRFYFTLLWWWWLCWCGCWWRVWKVDARLHKLLRNHSFITNMSLMLKIPKFMMSYKMLHLCTTFTHVVMIR